MENNRSQHFRGTPGDWLRFHCYRLSVVAGSRTSGPSRATCGAHLGKPAVADVISNGLGSRWELEEIASITNVGVAMISRNLSLLIC